MGPATLRCRGTDTHGGAPRHRPGNGSGRGRFAVQGQLRVRGSASGLPEQSGEPPRRPREGMGPTRLRGRTGGVRRTKMSGSRSSHRATRSARSPWCLTYLGGVREGSDLRYGGGGEREGGGEERASLPHGRSSPPGPRLDRGGARGWARWPMGMTYGVASARVSPVSSRGDFSVLAPSWRSTPGLRVLQATARCCPT